MELERRCCPFIAFSLRQEAYGGAVWLELTGSPGVEAFLAQTIAHIGSGASGR